MLKMLLSAALLVAGAGIGSAVEILREQEVPNYGINVVDLKDSTWRSRTMQPPEKSSAADRCWSGSDFFTSEYGQPLAFTGDPLKEYGFANGPYTITEGCLVFTTGEKGFQFGFGNPRNTGSEGGAAPIRFACAWGRQKKDVYRLRLELEQDVEETAWRFQAGAEGRDFIIRGRGAQVVETDLGLVREAIRTLATAITFSCTTPQATLRIRSLRLAPSSAEVFYRRSFDLAELPVLAHCSFTIAETYELYVNGSRIDQGTDIYPCAMMKTVDLRPHLRQGANTLAFVKQCHTWIGDKPAWLFEGVAVDRGGTLTRLLGDEAWRCTRRRAEGWMAPGFDDAAWSRPRLSDNSIESVLTGNERVFTGFNPRHMGRLDVAPLGRPYPLFDSDEPVRFTARLPLGLKDACRIELDVCPGGGDDRVEAVEPVAAGDDADVATCTFTPRIREPGPYRLNWRLLDQAGAVLETRREEAVILGPIKQDVVGIADFEAEFAKRLKLVTTIDCTQPVGDDTEFLDHAGMYNAPALNKGKVVEQDGLRYRETGTGRWDYFAYRLHLRDRGEPHLAEIVLPDNRDRYVYSGIVETFPVNFSNNHAPNGTGWYTATATAYTGVRHPLSQGQRRLRYVFYPGSRNAAIVVMSGFAGFPAAACAINIYRIEGGLPALQVADSTRIFGSHNERASTMRLTTGMAEQPMLADRRFALGLHQDAWFQWYRTLERKIRLLRHQGYNMAVEGVYMYNEGEYPSARHNVQSGDGGDFDPVPLMIRLYNKNGIRCLLGFEYIASPQVELSGKNCISERRMWQGEATTRLVDRYGRQLVGYMAGGYDFLNQDIAATMLDCVGEIYRRYESCGEVAGFYLVNGSWWLPTLNSHAYPELTDLEVGYGDDTLRLFERETGLRLGIDPTDSTRFQQRHALLTGKHLPLWTEWRARKMRDFAARIGQAVQGGKHPWKVYQYATIDLSKTATPYSDPASSRAARDGFLTRKYTDFGVQQDLYRNTPLATLVVQLRTWGQFRTPDESSDYLYGWSRSPGARRALGEFGAAFLGPLGLDEVDSPATAAKRWLWAGTARGVFCARAIGDNCMEEFVTAAMIAKPPTALFDQWLDCNLETGFGEQRRRFASSFYATPEAGFSPLPEASATGITAQSARLADGSTCLRLVNNTPYPCRGTFSATATRVRDLVLASELDPPPRPGYQVELKPQDIRVFRLDGLVDGSLACDFRFATETAAGIRQEAAFILDEEAVLRRIPGDMIARMYKALGRDDAFALCNVLNEPEVLANVRSARALRQAVANQEKLLGQLAGKGCARIDCGSTSPFTDPAGDLWLPDQDFTGGAAYGHTGASFVDRGDLAIAGTDKARLYQTEAYGGRVTYTIPVPNATYGLRLHFAETYLENTRIGQRQISVAVNGRMLPDRIDPFALAGGHSRPYILGIPAVAVSAALLTIELTGNVCLNAIEVEKSR